MFLLPSELSQETSALTVRVRAKSTDGKSLITVGPPCCVLHLLPLVHLHQRTWVRAPSNPTTPGWALQSRVCETEPGIHRLRLWIAPLLPSDLLLTAGNRTWSPGLRLTAHFVLVVLCSKERKYEHLLQHFHEVKEYEPWSTGWGHEGQAETLCAHLYSRTHVRVWITKKIKSESDCVCVCVCGRAKEGLLTVWEQSQEHCITYSSKLTGVFFFFFLPLSPPFFSKHQLFLRPLVCFEFIKHTRR